MSGDFDISKAPRSFFKNYEQAFVVHKFGGTSVGDAERIKNVAAIVSGFKSEPCAVVVSAMKGATDNLLNLVEKTRQQEDTYLDDFKKLQDWHERTVAELLKSPQLIAELLSNLRKDFKEIQEVLRGVWLARTASERIAELVSGYGEIWSAQFLNAYFKEQGRDSVWLDARDVLVIEPQEHSVTVLWEESLIRLEEWLNKNPQKLLVITGFVARTIEGVATTLRRNGSDYSASIFGALLGASEVTIWTDVDGVLSADPRLVPEAVVLDEMSYREVAELAYFGAKVVHPATMEPAVRCQIPVWIKNTFNPTCRGTKIHLNATSSAAVKGFSTINAMTLINVEGSGMVGVPGVSERLFGALRTASVSVVMISQASSEHSICLAVPQKDGALAKKVIEKAFLGEIQQGLIERVELSENCSVLAVVGDNMAHHPGVAARFFSALGRAAVNIRAIAQGSSERNISVVIAEKDAVRALRAVHSAFYLSPQTLSLGVIGTGLIAKAFMRQLEEQKEFLKKDRIDIRVRGIVNSKKMLLDDQGIDLNSWQERLEKSGQVVDFGVWLKHVNSAHLPHSIVLDATASAELPHAYPEWMRQGLHIVTPNKKANSSEMSFYKELRTTARSKNRHFLYSTNVGAGLPVIQTLRDLYFTGDKVISIEGILSGTLSFLFNSYDGKKPFSEIVREAQERGYTEPDPRDDLSGLDIARKLVILARETGLSMELSEVKIKSLVPESLAKCSISEFLTSYAQEDAKMLALLEQARARNEVLRFVGVLNSEGMASVELRSYPLTHAFARLNGSDNIVLFKTNRYHDQNLIIQGPGAGPEVTAAGVFADVLRLAALVGGGDSR